MKGDSSKCAKKIRNVLRSTKFIIASGMERNNQFEKQCLLSSDGVQVMHKFYDQEIPLLGIHLWMHTGTRKHK